MIFAPTSTGGLDKRQLWALPTPTETTPPTGDCKTLTLRAGGSIILNSSTIAFTSNVVYQPPCTGSPVFFNSVDNASEPIDEYKDPFYASVTPLVYIVALTTAISWMILIILLLLPGSYRGLGSKALARGWRRGDSLRNLFSSYTSPFPIGYRPWLQRFAALWVVMALTTVTADTFRHAEEQYVNGYSDATKLKNQVTGSIEVRVIRVMSDLFLWLAQIQTLIRLFPRRKEKLVIKWVGFVLILLDIIFSCLNTFYIDSSTYENRPRSYRDAIPALSYLFQLALNLLYAAWVGYYIMTKRRYAFYHVSMPEICIIAFIASLSLLIPVVFFLVDILKSDVSAWGDYFRWVGSAAASIVVWEWIERIELLEREEKKDGILGREIFEEDDLSDDTTPNTLSRDSLSPQDKEFFRVRRYQSVMGSYDKFGYAMRRLTGETFSRNMEDAEKSGHEVRQTTGPRKRTRLKDSRQKMDKSMNVAVPPPVASPGDRVETTSPSSTIYTVRYHTATQTPPMNTPHTHANEGMAGTGTGEETEQDRCNSNAGDGTNKKNSSDRRLLPRLAWITNAFHGARNSPPAEVKKALGMESGQKTKPTTGTRRGFMRPMDGPNLESDVGKSTPAAKVTVPTVIPPPGSGNQPWTPDRIRSATDPETSAQQSSLSQIRQDPISRGQSAAYDFAAGGTPTTHSVTPGGALSGTTVLNTDSPSEAARGSSQDTQGST